VEIQQVADGLEFPEGPIAMADGSVILTEIKAKRLTRVAPDGTKTTLVETGGGPNGAAIGPDGAVYITNNGGALEFLDMGGLCVPGPTPPSHEGGSIQRFDLQTGELTTLYDSCDGSRLVGPNDLVFDDQGGFWFTDTGCSTPDGRKWGALYYARADGSSISRQRAEMLSPNGVGFSPDATTLYVADTLIGRLWALDVDAPGTLAPQTGFAAGRVVKNLEGAQVLDSLAVEADGRVCVGTPLSAGITVFDPESDATELVPFEDPICTNICFGGADMMDAWITGSGTGRLFKARWPRAGLLLAYAG
jgi:gluconolactonase